MAKIVDYPRASLQRSLELARAVDSLGGECTVEMAASKLSKKVTGAFNALLSAAAKYGLVETRKQKVQTTDLFREHKLAYTPARAQEVLRTSFLRVPLFQQLVARFESKQLPLDILEKLLIRELAVPDDVASRVAMYFVEGAREVGLLEGDNTLRTEKTTGDSDAARDDNDDQAKDQDDVNEQTASARGRGDSASNVSHYSVLIRGPGMNSEIRIVEAEDLDIVDAMLKKVKRKLEILESDT